MDDDPGTPMTYRKSPYLCRVEARDCSHNFSRAELGFERQYFVPSTERPQSGMNVKTASNSAKIFCPQSAGQDFFSDVWPM